MHTMCSQCKRILRLDRVLFHLPRHALSGSAIPMCRGTVRTCRHVRTKRSFTTINGRLGSTSGRGINCRCMRYLLPVRAIGTFRGITCSLPINSISLPIQAAVNFRVVGVRDHEQGPKLMHMTRILVPFRGSSIGFKRTRALTHTRRICQGTGSKTSFTVLTGRCSSSTNSTGQKKRLPTFNINRVIRPFRITTFTLGAPKRLSQPIGAHFNCRVVGLVRGGNVPSFSSGGGT